MLAARAVFANVVAGRELRTRLRAWTPGLLASVYLLLLGLVTVVYLVTMAASGDYQSAANRLNFLHLLSLVQLASILLLVPVSVSDSLVGERTRGTWDLLIMTRLSAFHVIWGKSLACLCFQVLLLVAALPLYVVAFLFPGASPGEIVQVNLVLFAATLLAVTIGILVSLLARSTLVSTATGLGIAFGISVALSLLILGMGDSTQFSLGPLQVKPQLTRLAPLDPLAALVNSLPGGAGMSQVGALAAIQHPFGLPASFPLWALYVLSSTILSFGLVAIATFRMRSLQLGKT